MTTHADFQWQTDAPENHGLSKEELDALRKDLAQRRTRKFLVIRNDRILYEWYAPDSPAEKPHYTASMAKALVGGVCLALAIGDGKIALDDPVSNYVPQWKSDPLKSRITVRHLGSHTSGLEDSQPKDQGGWQEDFWKRADPPEDPFTISRDRTPLRFEPGKGFQYSNPGIAMLGYALAAAWKNAPENNLRALLQTRVMRPIGAPDGSWACGYGQIFEVDGLPLVAPWGGGNYTARTTARVGRLMLRSGAWDGRQLIPEEAVRQTASSAGLPGGNGMGWWTNAEGKFPDAPRNLFWAAGAGHQILLVVPDLDLICVRNGEQLCEGDEFRNALGPRLFMPLLDAVTRT